MQGTESTRTARKAFPKHLVRQLFSEKWKNSKHRSKRHRRRLRSPISMNPKGLATTRRMKKRRAGGGDPPWGSQSAARPGGAEPSVLDRTPKSVHRKALTCLRHLQISKSESLAPPIIPPGGQRIPPGRPQWISKFVLLSIKISIIF